MDEHRLLLPRPKTGGAVAMSKTLVEIEITSSSFTATWPRAGSPFFMNPRVSSRNMAHVYTTHGHVAAPSSLIFTDVSAPGGR